MLESLGLECLTDLVSPAVPQLCLHCTTIARYACREAPRKVVGIGNNLDKLLRNRLSVAAQLVPVLGRNSGAGESSLRILCDAM